MIKSISYLFKKKSLSFRLKEGHFLLYSEKQTKTHNYYSEFVYLLVKDRIFKLHLQYGQLAYTKKSLLLPDYSIIEKMTIKNHLLFSKILKHGRITTRDNNLVHYILAQEKKLNKKCFLAPVIPTNFMFDNSHIV